MGNPGLTVFLLFFGISLLDAFAGGHWLRGLLWVGVGIAFWGFDRLGRLGHGRRIGADKSGRDA